MNRRWRKLPLLLVCMLAMEVASESPAGARESEPADRDEPKSEAVSEPGVTAEDVDQDAEVAAATVPAELAATPQPARAAEDPMFTTGTVDAPDWRLHDLICSKLGPMARGGRLYLATMTFNDSRGVVKCMTDAITDGVEVHALVSLYGDAKERKDQKKRFDKYSKRFKAAIKAGGNDGSEFIISPEFSHAKFLALEGSGQPPLVVIGSQNLSTSDAQKRQQNVLIGDGPIFDAMAKYWVDVKKSRSAHAASVDAADGDSEVILFPNRRNDTYWTDVISRLEGNDECDVRIAMARWSSVKVAKAVARLKKTCAVEVVTRIYPAPDQDNGATAEVRKILKDAGIEMHILNRERVRFHSKYLVAYIKTNGHERHVVWSGSHNFSSNGSNDTPEVVLRSRRSGTYDEFKANFRELVKLAG